MPIWSVEPSSTRSGDDLADARLHFRDHDACAVDGGPGGVARGTERALAMAIGGRNLDESDIEGNHPFREEARDVREEHGREVPVTALDEAAHIGSGKERDRVEPLGVFGRAKGASPPTWRWYNVTSFSPGRATMASSKGVGEAQAPWM
jgi:hypothetical protein